MTLAWAPAIDASAKPMYATAAKGEAIATAAEPPPRGAGPALLELDDTVHRPCVALEQVQQPTARLVRAQRLGAADYEAESIQRK